jgi:signal peptidase
MTTVAFDITFRIVRALIGATLIAFLLFRGVLMFSGWVSESGTPMVFGREVFVVRSGSMSPAIATGDAVLVSSLDGDAAEQVQVGDIVTFRPASSDSILISHRIVDTVRNGAGDSFFVTKGDANSSRDTELLAPERIVGRVDGRLPQAGRLLVASQGLGLVTLFAAAFALAHVSVVLGRSARDLTRETLHVEGSPNERKAQ